MLTEHRFHTGVVTLNYAERGAAYPPLVLLHGGSTTICAERWKTLLQGTNDGVSGIIGG